jgi:hypothetical protein
MKPRRPRTGQIVLGRAPSDTQLTVASWIEGPARADGRAVLVSITDFQITRARDLVRVWVQGLRLRRAWPSMPGAIGLWLWAKPLSKRSGSVSVWRSEADLLRFVRWPRHVEIMRRNRGAGELTAAKWWTERCDPSEIWVTAERRLAGDDPELAHAGAQR